MNDLVMVYPMKSRTGFVQFINFVAGSNKGGVAQGDLFNNPFQLGAMTDERANYTSATVVEEVEEDGKVAWMQAGTVGCIDPATKTFVEGSVLKLVDGADPEVTLLEDVVAGDKVSYL